MERKTEELSWLEEWRIGMQEIRDIQKETARRMEETDRLIKETSEQMKETDRQMKESDKRFNDKFDKMNGKMKGIDDSLGYHAEEFFQDALEKSKTFGGVKYDTMVPNFGYNDGESQIEFDIALINGSSIAIIEVKSRVRPDFVKKFAVERVRKFREIFPKFKKHKVYLGIASFSFGKKALEKAKECGIGIIKQAGDSIEMNNGKLKAY